MDENYVANIKERSAFEASRTEPPDGFPKFPGLPLGRYTDPAFFALEREHLWKKMWLFAVHDSELPTNGSYELRDIAGAPILLVRGDDGVVRAFFNTCRHRGAPVVRGESGSARTARHESPWNSPQSSSSTTCTWSVQPVGGRADSSSC